MASPMALSRCLTIFLLVAMAATTGASEDGANFYVTCYPPPTPTPDGGSAFRGNLLGLLEALPSAAAPTGFAVLQTAGRTASDRALVLGLCLGDFTATPEPCRRCLSEAGKSMREQCGDASRHASFLDERCSVDYFDGAYSVSADDVFGAVSFSGDTVPSPDIDSAQRLVALAQSLAPRISDGSVATADATTPAASKGDATAGDRTVHVLAMCARDRGAADCVRCVREASLATARSWAAGSGAKGRVSTVYGSNCHLVFEISTAPPLQPPLTLGEMIRTLCAVFVKGVLVGVLIGIVLVALIEVYDRMRMKARNKNNKNAVAAAAVEAMSGIRTMK